jgi:hypothetical protein
MNVDKLAQRLGEVENKRIQDRDAKLSNWSRSVLLESMMANKQTIELHKKKKDA